MDSNVRVVEKEDLLQQLCLKNKIDCNDASELLSLVNVELCSELTTEKWQVHCSAMICVLSHLIGNSSCPVVMQLLTMKSLFLEAWCGRSEEKKQTEVPITVSSNLACYNYATFVFLFCHVVDQELSKGDTVVLLKMSGGFPTPSCLLLKIFNDNPDILNHVLCKSLLLKRPQVFDTSPSCQSNMIILLNAVQHYESGKFLEATSELQRIVDWQSPKLVHAWKYGILGLISKKKGSYSEALCHFKKSVNCCSTFTWPIYFSALVLFKMEKSEDAIKCLQLFSDLVRDDDKSCKANSILDFHYPHVHNVQAKIQFLLAMYYHKIMDLKKSYASVGKAVEKYAYKQNSKMALSLIWEGDLPPSYLSIQSLQLFQALIQIKMQKWNDLKLMVSTTPDFLPVDPDTILNLAVESLSAFAINVIKCFVLRDDPDKMLQYALQVLEKSKWVPYPTKEDIFVIFSHVKSLLYQLMALCYRNKHQMESWRHCILVYKRYSVPSSSLRISLASDYFDTCINSFLDVFKSLEDTIKDELNV